jgi:hypothetical protein
VFDQASDFLSKIRYGKIAANVRTTWIPLRTRYSLRQVRNSNSTVWTLVYHGTDARSSNMEITCIRSAVRMTISLVRTRETFIRKLLGADVRPLDDSASPSGRGSQTGKIFSKIFKISVTQLSVLTSYDHRWTVHYSPHYFVNTLCTHTLAFILEVNFYFSIGIRAWYTLRRLIS